MIFPNIGFWKQLMREEIRLFGAASDMPSCYEALSKVGLLDLNDSPALLYQRYTTAFSLGGQDSEPCTQVLQSWPDGMGGGGAVEAILLSSFEHLLPNARVIAVHFINGLLQAGHFTS